MNKSGYIFEKMCVRNIIVVVDIRISRCTLHLHWDCFINRFRNATPMQTFESESWLRLGKKNYIITHIWNERLGRIGAAIKTVEGIGLFSPFKKKQIAYILMNDKSNKSLQLTSQKTKHNQSTKKKKSTSQRLKTNINSFATLK